MEFLHFLSVAYASLMETNDHLETLFQTKSLVDKIKYDKLHELMDKLGRKLNLFIQSVEKNHQSRK
jgi:four helix bundle protein